MTLNDRRRRKYLGENYALWSDRELAEDSRAESAAITAYPDGISSMPVTSGANWGPNTGEAGYVVTERNGSTGKQTFVVPEVEASWVRYYESGGPWGDWTFFPSMADVGFAIDTALSDLHFNALTPEDINGHVESDVPDDYEYGLSFFYADTTSNWGPNDSQSGIVSTWIAFDGTVARVAEQTFTQFSDGVSYTRYYVSGAWDSWSSGGGSSDIMLPDDSRVFDDPPSAYPEGTSSMQSADPNGEGTFAYNIGPGVLLTHRKQYTDESATIEYITQVYYCGGTTVSRYWELNVEEPYWTSFTAIATQNDVITFAASLAPNLYVESDAPSVAFNSLIGIKSMPVTADQNWGPNTGQAGFVILESGNPSGTPLLRQTFIQSNGEVYYRVGSGVSQTPANTWTAWNRVVDESYADTLYKAIDYAPTWSEITSKPSTFPPTIGSGAADAVAGNDSRLSDQRVPTDGSVTSAKLATALANIISGKLDTSAYTAADVLSKFLTVDGSGSGTDADLLDGAHLSALMQASTYVGGDGKILVGVLPDTVVGGMDYQGTWNASTNSPSLSDAGTGRTKGDYYKVATAGATSLNSITDWKIGDWAVWNGTAWDKIDNTDSVSSVDGQTGAVSLSSTYKAIGYVPTWTEITSKPTTFAPIIGSGAADAVAGNDSRLTDTRTPTDGSVTSAKLATALANTISGKLDISDGRVLSQNENDAAQGTSGAPSDTNRFVTDADQRLQSARAAQTIGAAGAIAVGSDEVIPVTATADRTGVTVNAGGYSGQIISVVNRSAFSLTFDVTDATSRVVGGGAVAPNARYTLVWDADFGGAGVGRWIRLPIDTIAGIASMRTLGTGAAQALPGNHSSTTDARAPTTREFEAVFFFGSTLTTQVGVGKFKLPNSGTPTITEVTISVNTLPTGASVICDLNSVNNSTNAKTTLYSTQGNRPTIAAGGNYSNVATLPNTTQPGAGIEISVDIDQVGSPVAGSDLVVIVRGTY